MELAETLLARVDALRRELGSALSANGSVDAALLALQQSLEDVRIVEEELRAQGSELAETRRLLEESRAHYRDLFDLAPVGYLVSDENGQIAEANLAACELLGRSRRFLVGKPLPALVAPHARRAFRTLLREAARGGRWQDEVPFVQPGRQQVKLLVYGAGAPGASRAIRWGLAELESAAGPRARGELAAAYRVQRSRISHLLDRLQHAVLTVDAHLRVSYANTAAEQLIAGGAALAGRPLVDPWPEPSLRAATLGVFEARAEPADFRVAPDRERPAYDLVILPPDASGDALIVIADVSVAERRERAEREFVANAAHQLRTPVSAIASAVEVLQGGAKEIPEARDRFLEHLDRECNRLVRLTRALLVLARAQALSEPPDVELVPLRPLLDGIARGVHPGEGVGVRVDCPFDLATLTNAGLLEQAIGNLAENAAKATTAGEIVLCAESVGGGSVRLIVSDTGPGGRFPEDGRFERFYRDPASQGEGFGLGLAIASETIRVLGGNLRLEASDHGTRAIADLPAARLHQR